MTSDDKYIWVCLTCGKCGTVERVDYSTTVEGSINFFRGVMKDIIASHIAHNHGIICRTTELRVYKDSDHFVSVDPTKSVEDQ